ncbi:hypothetical protein ACVSMD_23760, partial [Pseudomonas aeruginosa]
MALSESSDVQAGQCPGCPALVGLPAPSRDKSEKPMKLLLRCLLLGAWVVSPSLWAWSNHT